MPAGLLDDALARVDEQDHQLRGGRAGHGVAGVLHVPGGVREHERAARSGEVPVGDIDGDALFTFRAQPVHEQRQIRCGQTFVHRRSGDGVDLVGQNGFRVVEQASDQSGLAVVDRTGGGQPQ